MENCLSKLLFVKNIFFVANKLLVPIRKFSLQERMVKRSCYLEYNSRIILLQLQTQSIMK